MREMMAAVIAANLDFPCADMYTSNPTHFHGLQGGSILRSGSCNMQLDMHMDMYDHTEAHENEMGSSSVNVEAQELADVLMGILDAQQAAQLSNYNHNQYIQCVISPQISHNSYTLCANQSSNYLVPATIVGGHTHTPFSPSLLDLHDSTDLLHADNLILASPFDLDTPDQSSSSLNSGQLNSDEEIHNEQDNLICGGALMPGLGLLNYDNPNLDDTNRSAAASCSVPQEACSKSVVVMHQDLEEFTLNCGINGGAEVSNYGDQEALKTEKDICSDYHVVCDDAYTMPFDDGFTKPSIDTDNLSKEHMLIPQPYQMLCDDDSLYPGGGMSMMQREAIYTAAALQPVDWAGILAVSAGTRPKRRNVRISHDPQTVSARRRRERISDRIRVLQRLVPGGTKMDTASMLDEAIHYLKFLKSQVQALEWLERRSASPLSISSSSSSPCFYPNVTPTSLPNSRIIK